MATFVAISLHSFEKIPISSQDIVPFVMRAERKAFARHEVFDFPSELMKRNTVLITVLNDALDFPMNTPHLVAYLAFTRSHNAITIHKMSVLEKYRRLGIAEKLLTSQIKAVRQRECTKIIRLWVDEQNIPARGLYQKLGFKEVNKVKNYYAPHRTGLSMTLDPE